MSKLYNIIDNQLGEYYEESAKLEDVKETAIRIMKRAIDEDDPQYKKENQQYLRQVKQAKTAQELDDWLSWFDYKLEEA